ncbi:putative AraC-type DNA-binding domain-containing protein [Vibrio nigripulchritudo SFn118]|nr:putative AraC-type DNA-binding domain-containing protein [Vibrio nigripulchritudo SFn118]
MDFRIIKPKKKLADHVQAIWSAKVVKGLHDSTSKPLYCDGGSGVTFLLSGEVCMTGEPIETPIYFQQYSKQTQFIELGENAELCGMRFHPGMMPSSLFSDASSSQALLSELHTQLTTQTNHSALLSTLYRWCSRNIELNNPSFAKRSSLIHLATNGKIGEQFQQSQRQVERQFREWIGMSPKYFQRLRRVHSSVAKLRENPNVSLSDFAYEQGFSDQAHMTREFKTFLLTTPGELSVRLKGKVSTSNHR